MRVAIIDLGTNSVRLFIYQFGIDGHLRELHHKKIMVRLGDNLFASKLLDPEACKRTIAAFQEFAISIKEHQVEKVTAVGTSAMREASDRGQLIEQIFSQTKIKLEVITGEQEAALIAQGILANSKIPAGPVALVDIGGGSTEVSLTENGKIISAVSLPIGAARGQQLFLKEIPPTMEAVQLLNERVYQLFAQNLPSQAPLIIGSSGSIRAIGELYHHRKSKHTFPRSFLKLLISEFQLLRRDQIAEIKGIKEKRADLILSAIIILDQLCNCIGAKRVRPTNYALKDGLLTKMLADQGK